MKRVTIGTSYDSRNGLYDLDSLFTYAYSPPFKLPQKLKMHACVMGENDEANWYWIFEDEKGQVYFAEGGCDYTGWDCQSWGNIVKCKSIETALKHVPAKEGYSSRTPKKWLKEQINGEEQVGVIKG